MRTLTILLVIALAGCSTVDYCDMNQKARCAWEEKLERRINSSLDSIASEARVDVVISCPSDAINCAPPEVVTSEAGDATILTIPIEP